MKKTNKIWYVVLSIIGVCIIIFGVYYFVAKNKNQNKEEQNLNSKVLSEINYIEGKFVNLFNKMNNIEYENYRVTVKNIQSEENANKEGNTTEKEKSGNTASSDSEDSSSQGENSQENQSTSEDSSDNQMYELQSIGVLTQDEDIKWENVKTEVENMYISLPTITLDLYQTNISQQDILEFNSKFDNLTSAIQNENKEDTLQNLIEMYKYMPIFVNAIEHDNLQKTILDTKLAVFQGYSKLDGEDWNAISNDIQTGVQKFAQLLTDVQIDDEKQYAINKVYVMLNELKSASDKENREAFLIKYKNLIEEMNNV